MQLLKEMYAELDQANAPDQQSSDQQSSDRPNQSEFLCYHILRRLDEKGLVREISLIDPDTRKTDHLRFAIRTFVAYKTLNYHTFMRLLLDASPLQACILNRYLPQVRLNAFHLLKKATSSPLPEIHIPQDYLMKTLLLKQNELAKFCESIHCGLANQKIVFKKNQELKPVDNFPRKRIALIDRKFGKLKLSNIVNGSVQKEISSVDELLGLFQKVDFFNNPT